MPWMEIIGFVASMLQYSTPGTMISDWFERRKLDDQNNNKFVTFYKNANALDCRDTKYNINDNNNKNCNENFDNLLLPKNLISLIAKYREDIVDDPNSVYIMFGNTHIIIMQKIENTVSNEFESDFKDRPNTRFRADNLLVKKIINVDSLKTVQNIKQDREDVLTIYEVGKNAESTRYKMSTNSIHSSDIYYFNTIKAAYFYRFDQ